MQRIIVSDTSCLILFYKLGRLELLKELFGTIYITQVIADEFGTKLPNYIEVENPKDKIYQKLLESFLDAGEASAIALALEKEDCLLIIDDLKGRKEAKRLDLNFTGTVGILITAKERKLIASVSELLIEIGRTDFRISETLILEVRRRCGE